MSEKLPGPPNPWPGPQPPNIVLINKTGMPLDFVFKSRIAGGQDIPVNVHSKTSVYYSYDPNLYVIDPNSAPGGFWIDI